MKQFLEWAYDKNKKYWGYHLLVDIAGCDKEPMKDESIIKNFFKELVPAIDMKTASPIMIKRLLMGQPNQGFSAVQIIETSSITMHFVETDGTIYLDVFSCKTFEPKIVLDMVKKYFKAKTMKHKFITRDANKK